MFARGWSDIPLDGDSKGTPSGGQSTPKKRKPIIICGDLNVAFAEKDLANPKTNHFSAGFTDQERQAFGKLLDSGFVDAYRHLYPDKVEYTWWSYMRNARERNIGWRIDYFLISDWAADMIKDVRIRTDIMGSDHCPVELIISDEW